MSNQNTPGLYWQNQDDMGVLTEQTPLKVAFIGFTERAPKQDENYTPVLCESIKEFEERFGLERKKRFDIHHDKNTQELHVEPKKGLPEPGFLHSAITQFFVNGGFTCYVISISEFDFIETGMPGSSLNASQSFEMTKRCAEALTRLEQQPDVNLIAIPESICLQAEHHYQTMQTLLLHCQNTSNRFAIIDVHQKTLSQAVFKDDTRQLRKYLQQSLAYGAAYYPYLHSEISPRYAEVDVSVQYQPKVNRLHQDFQNKWRRLSPQSPVQEDRYIEIDNIGTLVDQGAFEIDSLGQRLPDLAPVGIYTDDKGQEYLDAQGFVMQGPASRHRKKRNGRDFKLKIDEQLLPQSLFSLDHLGNASARLSNQSLAEEIRLALTNDKQILPPSAAIAGVMQSLDDQKGVWYAPANITLLGVTGPVVNLDDSEQAFLNVDASAGKSVNALRNFTGLGCKIWGGRTLLGNSDEWRYICVRRFFLWLEKTLSEKTQFAVFERSGPFTWLKMQVVCETYLNGLWLNGALYGLTPSDAFQVEIGLGSTMTAADVNNGLVRMTVKIAAQRPAEFITISFTHQSHSG